MNRRPLALVLVVFGLALLALALRDARIVWLAMPILGWLGAGLLLLPDSLPRLVAARRVASEPGAAEVTVEVSLRNTGSRPLVLRWNEAPPGSLVRGNPAGEARLVPGGEAGFSYTFHSVRGTYSWTEVKVAAVDPLGVWEVPVSIPAAASLCLPPVRRRYRSVPLRPDRTLSSPGPVPTRLGGSGTDFWGVREYHPGDPPGRLDWRLTARRPHQFFTRDFTVERTAAVVLILDARTQMDITLNGRDVFEDEAAAAAALAESLLRQGQRVGLVVYGGEPLVVAPGFGGRQYQRIATALAGAAVVDRGPGSLEHLPVGHLPLSSFLILFSPLVPGDERALGWLQRLGYQILVVRPDVLDSEDLAGTEPVEALALRMARLERRMQGESAEQHGVRIVDWKAGEPLPVRLRAALRSGGRRRPSVIRGIP